MTKSDHIAVLNAQRAIELNITVTVDKTGAFVAMRGDEVLAVGVTRKQAIKFALEVA